MHERRSAQARDAARQTPAAPVPDALWACLSSAGNAAFAGRTPLPRTLGRTPAVEADLELQRALAGTLAREEAAAADPAASPADPAARERADFLASCPRLIADHQPSTHFGQFDVRLEPPHMTLTVKVRFIPMGGRWDPEDLQVKLPAFQQEWLQTASGFWRPGLFTFWSQRPGWEDISVSVIPEFRIAEPGEKEHVLIEVTNTDKNHGREHHSKIDNQTPRRGLRHQRQPGPASARRGIARRPPTRPVTCSGSARSTSTAAPRPRTSRRRTRS